MRRPAAGVYAAQLGVSAVALARRHREYRAARIVVGQQAAKFRRRLVMQAVALRGAKFADGVSVQRHAPDCSAAERNVGELSVSAVEGSDDAAQHDFVAARKHHRRIAPHRKPCRRTSEVEIFAPHYPRRSERRPAANHRRFVETQRHHARFAVRRLRRSVQSHSQCARREQRGAQCGIRTLAPGPDSEDCGSDRNGGSREPQQRRHGETVGKDDADGERYGDRSHRHHLQATAYVVPREPHTIKVAGFLVKSKETG